MAVAAQEPAVLGATPAQWSHWRNALGLGSDLLPVVADQAAIISEHSSLRSIGKTPSSFNAMGKVAGIPDWTHRQASAVELRDWSSDNRLGVCVQTRALRAIDVDLECPVQAESVAQVIEAYLMAVRNVPVPPRRGRPDSSKFLVPVWASGQLKKRVVKCQHGRVELLADGQQFVAVSTHPSGKRYVWSGDGLVTIDGEAMPTGLSEFLCARPG